MTDIAQMQEQRLSALRQTASGAPKLPSNPFFGVGPITDATTDEVDSRLRRIAFDAWIEKTYRKFDDRGNDIGGFTTAEISRSMHRGYPADKILTDMMRAIHRYFGFPKTNRMAVGLGGGHSGFTVCIQHLMNANDAAQRVYVDTPRPESDPSKAAGFFRQSWATQLIEMQRFAEKGCESRIHFAASEGVIPTAAELSSLGVSIFVGVGHETTGANAYTSGEIHELLNWLDGDPANRHAVFDATSMLGAMPWEPELVSAVMAKCCLFMPFQKAIGGVSGYFVASFTPHALALIEKNQQNPAWAIPRQLKIAPPIDPRQPFSAKRSVDAGPFFDPAEDRMLGGVINTYSALAFAETTFGLLQSEARVGSVVELNRRSAGNRAVIDEWVKSHPLLSLTVTDAERRGAAVTLLKVEDDGITDAGIHARIIARSKQLLGYEGITHPNGEYEPGLDAARYVNAFPGTPGDYRAWVGGIREPEDVVALLENLQYAYLRAKIVVLEEELAKNGVTFEAPVKADGAVRKDDPNRAYTVLIADLVGLRFGADGEPDYSEIKAYIEEKGGSFHLGPLSDRESLEKGRIHFFYQPNISTEAEILPQTDKGQYDALIAAATFIPKSSLFPLGGVRIGAGTGNMGSASWGGGNGEGGTAALMNTPGINSRATAQMALKAILKVVPDLPVDRLHRMVAGGDFDTGRQLKDFPTSKLEGRKLAVLGYGNIGREVAKLAKAFGMKVAIYAREHHKRWIEAEGFDYAASPVEAASGADVLSVHIGLGRLDAATGTYSNAGTVNTTVLGAMKDGAVLVNYDRGEVVDPYALDAALSSGKIAHAAIDADLFRDAATGTLSGPMLPYLPLEERHKGKLELLPHAAADTDHPSRVTGAKQAVDQIFDVIRFKSVVNLKGDLPEGYVSGGSRTPAGIGRVTKQVVAEASGKAKLLEELRQTSEKIAAITGALSAVSDEEHRGRIVERYTSLLVENADRQRALLDQLGLYGPAEG
ncbi:lactate dehydrogenase-like 2-hydroxyacid dehydrogenase/phosphoserine aminotransferase [Rhizobium leguminosarum]|uniref:NAD(P)-dependent oxidoreductase n=1 Tax=Rhizobium leguminosarum TaxID=384 RepID=UPI001610E37F|nr:NAD(P)-dependent oxidoreductase [Rhizobium leguminosarum]MBB5666652.1 lactate dehydrogenase-like 2-hydroxyacid dehydrogenase/phosphoserine aminotransferase [Rhizobium leguminosarum]